MLTVGILLLSVTAVLGFYEVSVSDAETHQEHHEEHHGGTYLETMHECISPLYQTLHGPRATFMQTTAIEDVVAQVASGGHTFRGVVGKVAMKRKGCECEDGTDLVPVHLMTKVNTFDYYLVADKQFIENYKKNGYVDRGINFWCSPEKDKCGASLPLYSHTCPAGTPFNHAYTTNEKQTNSWDSVGWKREGLVCYIWPTQYLTHNYVGEY